MGKKFIQNKMVSWYHRNKRELPWRNTSDPYKIWLSEVILQQTKVIQGLNYYIKFTKTYPTIQHLANAEENEVLKLWQGLGYYSRARNLHFAAKQINNADEFPDSYKKLLKLKGVGEYTAAAIASFAFNEKQAVVDGNVYRVLSRIYGIETAIDSTEGKKEFKKIADWLLLKSRPGEWNQVIMEFGALQCTPKSPNCNVCPVQAECVAYSKKTVSALPFKKGKTKQQIKHIYYFFIKANGNTFIAQRPKTGIWGGLFEFPNIELEHQLEIESAISLLKKKIGFQNSKIKIKSIDESIKHVLSHRILYCTFIEIETNSEIKLSEFEVVPLENIEKYPVSRLIEKYLKKG